MPSDSSQHSLSDLSARFDLELHGDGDHLIRSAGTLQGADSSSITFLANPAYRAVLPQTTAGAVILRKEDAPDCPTNCLVSDDPYLAYARIATLFDPRPEAVPGIHPSAVIDESVKLGTNLSIGPNVTIEAGSTIGDGSTLSPGVVVGTGCEIGADGFGIAFAGDHWEKVPQIGNVIIGDDCEIGANSCVDRGAIGDTVLEEDVRLDNLVQIGHNVTIGAHSALAGTAAVAGSTTVGKYCLIAGGVGIAGHLEIADRVTITANAKVMRSILDAGSTVGSIIPAQPFHEWQKILARLLKIDRLAKRLRALEKTMEAKSHNE
jgi:UDP-3-O-[3-hydroxymyristoyl] glucosamine N-acyltransferase